MLAGVAPINRAVSPSMRISDVSGWARPVQGTVATSVSRSAGDQIEKYGSCATSGTAGGRKTGGRAGAGREITLHCGAWPASVSVAKPPAMAATQYNTCLRVIVPSYVTANMPASHYRRSKLSRERRPFHHGGPLAPCLRKFYGSILY